MKHFSKLFKLSFLMSLTAFLLLTASPAYAANVFETITGRAVGVLTGVKQLVFVLAGFGIIAFAFMAIFGKLSWKHFAHIAIGLFLVASMGLFIQYFVTKDGTSYKLSYGNYLGSAFGDTAGTAGDSFGGADGSLNPDGSFGGGAGGGSGTGAGAGGEGSAGSGTETSGGKIDFDPVTGMPSLGLETTAPDTGLAAMNTELPSSAEKKKEKRGFKGFISDVKNIANAAQQAKSAVDAGINFAKNAAATYENVKNSVENNGTGIKGLLNSASDIAGGLKDLKQGAESTVSTIGAKTSGVANSIQDVGKTEQQLAENRQVRNDGGSTNKISEWLNREGKGGSTANEIKDRVDKTANPVLDNVGEAAYDAKGVVTMAGSGDVSGIVGAAAGAAAGVGAILNATGAVGGSRSDNGNTGGGNEQPTVQTQEQSTTPTIDRLKQGNDGQNNNPKENVSGGVTSDRKPSDVEKWSEDNGMVRKGDYVINGEEWDYNMETGEIRNPVTGEVKSKKEFQELMSNGEVKNAGAVKENEARKECSKKSAQGYKWDANTGSCLSPSQVAAEKEKTKTAAIEAEKKAAAIQAELDKKCPEGKRWVDGAAFDGGGMCLDTKETAAKRKEEAAKKVEESKKKKEELNKKKKECEAKEGHVLNKKGECVKSREQLNKDNPELAKQISLLGDKEEAEMIACNKELKALRSSCQGLKNPQYTECLIKYELKQEECNGISSKYTKQREAIQAKMK